MATCKRCGGTFEADDLTRHEVGGLVIVHCPNCKFPIGTYNRHSEPPETDRLRT